MKRVKKRRKHLRLTNRCQGFTLVETVISLGVMAAMGYVFSAASNMGNNSYSAVQNSATRSAELRAAGASIASELKLADADNVVVTVLGDGNHEVTFQQPLVVGGALLWGAHDAVWGPTEADKNRPDWWIHYTVSNAIDNDGNLTRQLVRQVLDPAGDVREEEVVVNGLRSGQAQNPGFNVVQAGDVWVIQVYTEGQTDGNIGKGVDFNVRIKN